MQVRAEGPLCLCAMRGDRHMRMGAVRGDGRGDSRVRKRQKGAGPCGETSVPTRHVLWQAHEEKLREMVASLKVCAEKPCLPCRHDALTGEC
jgi:hypothetical protein